ncbi:TPA: hypothetical protein I9Y43_004772 [Kluyvera ascorbata]|uniref:hypothetical protein n=1 Tax=Enterobacter kobei TaxID=208224 RepID=UPI001A2C84FE|nr:hypothetical protein [Kluyvera ascorbata]
MADGISWVPLYSALAGGGLTGGIALLVTRLNHHYTLLREERTAAAKQKTELYFISTELVFRLERFAQGCAEVVNDEGFKDDKGYTQTSIKEESFSTDNIDGDWRVLPDRILYRIRELSVLIPEAIRYISIVSEYDDPPDWQMSFKERRYQYSRMGLRAMLLARRLRRLNAMPSSHLDNNSPWSVQNVLWSEWRKQRKSRARHAREVPDYNL